MAEYKDITPEDLKERAWDYIKECKDATKEIATTAGVKTVKERHLPTTAYFLNIWLPLKDYETYARPYWYDIMKNKEHPLSDTIKKIDEVFSALATDIVANEGKGIFYAKNKLGMTDKMQESGSKEVTIKVKYDRVIGKTTGTAHQSAEDTERSEEV